MALSRTGAGIGSGSASDLINEHLADTTDAHDASAISYVPTGNLAADDVQEALTELQGDIDAHLADTADAHDASAISVDSTTLVGVGTDVQAVLEELDNGIADHLADAADAHDASAISLADSAGYFSATDVEAAIAEVVARFGPRNRIINGDMRIDQRNSGSAVTVTSAYTLDRWLGVDGGSGAATIQRLSATPPEGFTHYLRWAVTTADTAAAAEFYFFRQAIEGVNVADFDFGKSSAKTITLSFRVRSSLTGTFGGAVQNSATNRSYPFSFAISQANTWETKTIVIAGDTTGTWLTDSGVGLYLLFDMGSGSDFQGTAGAWVASNHFAVTGQTAVQATLNATFDITGVQLEVGSAPTPFERRPYGQELALCQRYYWRWVPTSTDSYFCPGLAYTTTLSYGVASFPVPMRTAPTAVETSGTAADYRVLRQGTSVNCNVVPSFNQSSKETVSLGFSVAAGLTAGEAILQLANALTGYLGFSAEL